MLKLGSHQHSALPITLLLGFMETAVEGFDFPNAFFSFTSQPRLYEDVALEVRPTQKLTANGHFYSLTSWQKM